MIQKPYTMLPSTSQNMLQNRVKKMIINSSLGVRNNVKTIMRF